MAQSEDTELRDLVMEALEKNGSLAKIRALLRANIFLAFEDDYESIRQNGTLDNVLKVPEGILALSIVHEFLDFCNLKNTLFVYKSETRQEKEYKYEGHRKLCEKLDLKQDGTKEPVLVSIVKYVLKSHKRYYMDRNNIHSPLKNDNNINYKDEQNCTYIVHDDSSSTTSQSQSDNSSDEKTKLHLRLQLDNSDTDTSSDSAREKSCSEYMPNEHILHVNKDNRISNHSTDNVKTENQKNLTLHGNKANTAPFFLNELKILNNSSSETKSSAEKSVSPTEQKLQSISELPAASNNNVRRNNQSVNKDVLKDNHSKSCDEIDSTLNTLNSISSISLQKENDKSKENEKKSLELLSSKSETENSEYSNDFTQSGASKNKEAEMEVPSPQSIQEDIVNDNRIRTSSIHSPHDSHSSLSLIHI